MNRTLVFAAAGAFGTALLMAIIISASMGGGKEKSPAREILVAAKDLPVGAPLTDSAVRWQKWPDAATIPGALVRDKVKEDEWKEQKLRRSLTAGEPVTSGALVREIKGSYLAASLDEGMRAIAIDVKAASGVAGFLSPGDRVDVILIYRARVGGGDQLAAAATESGLLEKASETIVENVRVMATDQDSLGNTAGGERKAKVNKTVTLEVTPKDAEKIAVATEMGSLHLALRQLGDNSSRRGQSVGTTDLGAAESLRRSIQETGGGGGTGRVRVYSGAEVQEIKIVPNAGSGASGENP